MGNLLKVLAISFVLTGSLLLMNMQDVSSELTTKEIDHGTNMLARNVARAGHDLLLSQSYDVISGRWKNTSSIPVGSTVNFDGGRFWVTSYVSNLSGDTVSFKIRSEHFGAVHEIDASYAWEQFIAPNPWILSGAPLDMSVDPSANLNLGGDSLGIDISVVDALGEMFDSLGVAMPPQLVGLTPAGLTQTVEDAFHNAGHTTVNVMSMDASQQIQMGEFSPDALISNVENHLEDVRYTPLHKRINASGASNVDMNLSGSGKTGYVVEIRSDAVIDRLIGSGTLLIDGGLNVPYGSTLDWKGLIVLRGDGLKTVVDLQGDVNIEGSILTAHNTGFTDIGHIDVSSWRDNDPWPWPDPTGQWHMNEPNSPPLYRHKHRYDVERGPIVDYNRWGFLGFRHNKNGWANQGPMQLVFLRAQTAHGKSTYTFKLQGQPAITGLVEVGFPVEFRDNPTEPFVSKPFYTNQVEEFNIRVKSRPHLAKTWDTAAGYGPHCGSPMKGPRCVSQDYNRNGAFTIRIYEPGDNDTNFETAIYWHMLQSEVDEYQNDLNQMIADLQSGVDSGLEINIGANTSITYDRTAVNSTGVPEGIGGPNLLSINERHYNRTDPNNPCTTGVITGCAL